MIDKATIEKLKRRSRLVEKDLIRCAKLRPYVFAATGLHLGMIGIFFYNPTVPTFYFWVVSFIIVGVLMWRWQILINRARKIFNAPRQP